MVDGEGKLFLFVGNHPCLDFVNTQMIVKGEPTDLLETVDDLFSWLVQARLLAGSQSDVVRAELNHKEARSLLEQAKMLRASLRGAAERIAARQPVSDSTVAIINQVLSRRPGYPQLVRTKQGFERRFYSQASTKDALLLPLAEAASDLLCLADLAQIKKCGNAACILYFYDTTKNHRRSWCSMRLCGNRIKVAAYFQRKKHRSKR